MEFTVQTTYNQKTMTTMSRVLRKTMRKKSSRRFHILGWAIAALGLFMSLVPREGSLTLDFDRITQWLAVALLAAGLIWEDSINGLAAKLRTSSGRKQAKTVFGPQEFCSETQEDTTRWKYESIVLIAETRDSFVFAYSKNHAQLFDKAGLSGGSPEEFAALLEEKTGKKIQKVY